ncbi:MAG: formylglycine-generating enzyme family protein [Desulfuromonadaceae bacterium]|nr:formylglycine-generating enzyme family protein [Desulfuromonadaceae bacterium]MDD2856988.1 formylglycine-generating enzyme family protein [Desulfuromonadaceae bacterium]
MERTYTMVVTSLVTVLISFIFMLLVTTKDIAFAAGHSELNASKATEPDHGLYVPDVDMKFMYVPAGCFSMGDTFGDGQGDEKPVHEVCLDSYYMGEYEVSNAQFRMYNPDHSSGSYEGNTLNNDDQPVGSVSWYDAAGYADWLTKKTGRYFRLPTEAEWEYAARGGTNGRNFWDADPVGACRYTNGADLTAKSQWQAWATTDCNDGFKVSAPVGSFKPNSYGLYDLMGNAWEWTNDWYDPEYYFKSPVNNPRGSSTGSLRIPRGGGWGNASECVRVSDRNGFVPDFRVLFLGFRLVSPFK